MSEDPLVMLVAQCLFAIIVGSTLFAMHLKGVF